jgi:hypothetical protein
MSAGGPPQLDVVRVQRWCANQVPEHMRSEIRVECDITPRHLTICECRPPWREDFGPDWTRFPIARLHYTKTTGLWTLYWRDHNLNTTATNHSTPAPKSKTYSTTSTAAQTPSSGDNHRLPSSQ